MTFSPADIAFSESAAGSVPDGVREGFARATEVFSERQVCHAVDHTREVEPALKDR